MKKGSIHYLKSVCILSFSGLYFPTFGLNTDIYSVNLHVQSKCGEIWTGKSPNIAMFYSVIVMQWVDGNN